MGGVDAVEGEPNTPRLGARRRRGEGGLAYLSLHACESCVVSNSLARMHMDMLACSLLQGKLRRIRLPPCGCGLGCARKLRVLGLGAGSREPHTRSLSSGCQNKFNMKKGAPSDPSWRLYLCMSLACRCSSDVQTSTSPLAVALCLRPAGSCRTARGSPVRRGATSTRAPRPAGSSELESGDRVEVWEGLAAEAAAVLAEGPEGEDVAVVCVRDHAVVVEDAYA